MKTESIDLYWAVSTGRVPPWSLFTGKVCGQASQQSGSRIRIRCADGSERSSHGRLDRAFAATVERPALGREIEMHPPRVAFAPHTRHETGGLEALHDTGDGAGIEVEEGGQRARSGAGLAPDEANGETLRRRQPEAADHALGDAVELVVDGPQQPDEIECGI